MFFIKETVMREKLGEKLFSKMVSKRSFLKKAGAAAGVVGAYSVGAPFVHAQNETSLFASLIRKLIREP